MFARLLILSLAVMLWSCAPTSPRGPVVLAAASMQEAIGEIADSWAAQGHARPVLSFAGTPALARQVEAGAPADLFIAADEAWMDELERKQLLKPGSRRVIVGNALVLVAPATKETGGNRLAMADPNAVPAGRYGKAALESLGLWEEARNRIVPTENVRAALALVERGEVAQGLVYASDAAASRKVRVLQALPASSHPPIRYPLAVLSSSTHADAGALADFIAGPEGQAILQQHGFRPAP
ncbi:MAG: molybdate ABC transporter substrate-binding protein [Sphingomonadaceae bacterium]|nr:molybdate ABC transporter substrate-binding protein [Sphingomonadaceae bacterium]